MGWGGALVLAVLLITAAAAQDNADGLPSKINDDNITTVQPGARKISQKDATMATKDTVTADGDVVKNGTDKNHDKSQEGTLGRSDVDSGGQSTSKTQSSQETVECDDRCVIKNFTACLRVPGEDSGALPLVMDNKGMGPLDVNITAPKFVNVDEVNFQLEAKGHKEMKVSIRATANVSTGIVLKTGEGNCTLQLPNPNTTGTAQVPGYISLTSRFILLCLFLLLAMVAFCVKLRTRNRGAGPVYQKLDMDLPVSSGGKKQSDQSDQWDSSWGEDWGDEEAPLTPSKPRQNLSLKGLASRRTTKDGWKD